MPGIPLITGATGFAGGHLLDLLLTQHDGVHAWFNPGGRIPVRVDARVLWRAVDMLDRTAVESAFAETAPSVVYHCAGVADVQRSWQAAAPALEVNVLGVIRADAGEIRYGHNDRKWDWFTLYSDYGDGFRADDGFVPQVGFRRN